jgi:AcrR family transcriptional regulator
LYHHFKDKKDLFKAVYDEEQKKLAQRTNAAAAAAPDALSAMVAGTNAMLEACLEPARASACHDRCAGGAGTGSNGASPPRATI